MADPTVDDQGHVMLRPPLDEAPTQDQIDKQDADFEACKEQVGLEAPPSTDGE